MCILCPSARISLLCKGTPFPFIAEGSIRSQFLSSVCSLLNAVDYFIYLSQLAEQENTCVFDNLSIYVCVYIHIYIYIATAAAKSLQSCLTLCDPHGRQPIRLPRPWDSPGKNTGVGCLFLLQCMKVKSESEVAQSCPTPSDPMDCSLLGCSVHGIFQARVLEWGAIAFSDIYVYTYL